VASDNTAIHLDEVISGQLDHLDALRQQDWRDVLRAAASRRLVLQAGAVVRVLRSLGRPETDARLVQAWASFMRRGYFEGSPPPITPIEIDFDESRDEAIAEAVARLDELGDAVDGTLSAGQAGNLVKRLGAS
jgi:hypothetical protein